MKTLWLIPVAFTLMAAAPQRQLSLSVPWQAPAGLGAIGLGRGPVFEPAPLPNRDLNAPATARASNEPSLAPTLFTARTQYRGDGFSPGSTAQSEQERNVKPGAGFSLHMPLTPQ